MGTQCNDLSLIEHQTMVSQSTIPNAQSNLYLYQLYEVHCLEYSDMYLYHLNCVIDEKIYLSLVRCMDMLQLILY